jgi:hypothetical protein
MSHDLQVENLHQDQKGDYQDQRRRLVDSIVDQVGIRLHTDVGGQCRH